jgi:phage baseplate assembly protein W
MNAFGVALPLNRSNVDGFVMIKSIKKLVRQNLKMLILTNPGERVMRPNFGVGIKNYLFEHYGENIQAQINAKIRNQAEAYMPAVEIVKVFFEGSEPDSNRLSLTIVYAIPDINVKDLLQITI